jgi:hypothetical protein
VEHRDQHALAVAGDQENICRRHGHFSLRHSTA